MSLVAVLLVGNEVNGAKRWIPLVIVNFQPTELFKLAVILYLASLFTRREEVLRSMEHLGWRSIWRGDGQSGDVFHQSSGAPKNQRNV